jgi:hypothetical protein
MIALLTFRPPIPPTPVAPYDLDYLVIAGGGAGGGSSINTNFGTLGSAGAGGYLSGTLTAATNPTYTIFIGAGGTQGPFSKGYNSYLKSFSNYIQSTGGGGGGYPNVFTPSIPGLPINGGSGFGIYTLTGEGPGIPGQGFPGGNTSPSGGGIGGGGGAGQAGESSNLTAKGGDGLTWVDGVTRGGGGGGFQVGISSGTTGVGGAGGGGNGGWPTFQTAGAVNTGGGGGLVVNPGNNNYYGANGGSGIVKVRYAGTPRATGGTITQDGGFTYHAFTSSGRLIFTS